MKPINDILIIDDVFDDDVINQLHINTLKHFEKNLMCSDFIDITNSIIDCHGLALSQSRYFPYSINCWNIFCLKIKKYVAEYCLKLGYDETFLIPFSCWAERSDTKMEKTIIERYNYLVDFFGDDSLSLVEPEFVNDSPQKVIDHQVKKHFIRSVYILDTPDPFFGTEVYLEGKVKSIPSKKNRLIVYDGSHPSTQIYPKKESKMVKLENPLVSRYNIIFDWYVNDPFDVPDWILP